MVYLRQERAKRSWLKGEQASQIIAKPGLTRNKLMLCVWWDWKGIIHYEFLPPGKTIKSDLYCQQLMRLNYINFPRFVSVDKMLEGLFSKEARERPSDRGKPDQLALELPPWFDEDEFNK
ncbi:Mariner Mos1 transposase [Eumeta japonica]|uniref:Mariner Mos1 transposase n=1 Tax=Eumeta variegata TaxID=151549 RepID=A0A4C1Y695_EUMVA|nr:Mariner Mos1 transposase [Eumeta japonica]